MPKESETEIYYKKLYENLLIKLSNVCEEYIDELKFINPMYKEGVYGNNFADTERYCSFIELIIKAISQIKLEHNFEKKYNINDLLKYENFFKGLSLILKNDITPSKIQELTKSLDLL